MFVKTLDVDEVVAQLLVTEGFTSIEDVAYVPLEELGEIQGFEGGIAEELQSRARGFIDARNAELETKRKELGVEDTVAAVEGLTPAHLVTLGENGVKTLDDLGDLAGDELKEILDKGGHQLDLDSCNAMILAARKHWFPDEQDAGEAAPGASA
jgi:transcription termination/antitermination protein NusA